MSLYVSLYICILRETLSVLASNSIPCFLQESLLLHSMKKTEKKKRKKKEIPGYLLLPGLGGLGGIHLGINFGCPEWVHGRALVFLRTDQAICRPQLKVRGVIGHLLVIAAKGGHVQLLQVGSWRGWEWGWISLQFSMHVIFHSFTNTQTHFLLMI